MFFSGASDSGSRPSPRELMLRQFGAFPGHIAVLRNPSSGTRLLAGGENENGHPHSIHVLYVAPDGQRLLVRTKVGPECADADNRAPIFIDTLYTAFGISGRRDAATRRPPRGATSEELASWRRELFAEFRRAQAEYEALPQIPVSVPIDGIPVPGFRVDYPDRSGVELAWDGRTVQCVGEAAAIDVLALRRAVPTEVL
jgi:hypothetical protein